MIDLLFGGAVYALVRLLGAIEMQSHGQPLAGAIVIALVPWALFFVLLTLRGRLALWPIHVWATGCLLDLQTPWNKSDERSGSSAERAMAAFCFGLLSLVVLGTIASILAPSQAIKAGPIAIPIAIILTAAIFRALQLAGLVMRYRAQTGSS